MLEEKIIKKRKELNESIEKNKDYDTTYKLSIELDDLISQFYEETKEDKTLRTNEKIKVLYMV